MHQLDAIRLSTNVRQRLTNFVTDDSFVRDPQLTAICKRIWGGAPEQGGLVSDLWVEGAFPAMTADPRAAGKTTCIDDLVQRGMFSAKLRDQLNNTDAVPANRPLYLHQRDAILKTQEALNLGEHPAIVVTAGTGAGKTESFLLPMLNDLYETHPQERQGVECIILYPMNALVNDQVDRLYDWLKGQGEHPICTLFHMTSETPEDVKAANNTKFPKFEECRVRTRKQARGLETRDGYEVDPKERLAPPRILITNYSMLEYMLCRPQDAPFFGTNLRTIVLDEAHLYTGTLAAEMTLLLRRLLDRCNKQSDDVLQIATSATIGGDPADLREFIAQIFSKNHESVHLIEGKPDHVTFLEPASPIQAPMPQAISEASWLDQPTLIQGKDGTLELRIAPDTCKALYAPLQLLVSQECLELSMRDAQGKPALLLYRSLLHSPIMARVEDILWKRKRLSLQDFAIELFSEVNEVTLSATTRLLQLGAIARESLSKHPVVPHRLHLLVKTTSGLSICLNPDCPCDENRRLKGLGCVLEGMREHCPHCLSSTLTLVRCNHCGEWALGGKTDGRKIAPLQSKWSDDQMPPNLEVFSLVETAHGQQRRIAFDGSIASQGVYVWQSKVCVNCGEETKWVPFTTNDPYALSTLAESVLSELPHFPSNNNEWLPARGRRLLTFSDSRQEAARLGPRLTRSHELQLFRAIQARELTADAIDPETIAYYETEIISKLDDLNKSNLSDSVRRRITDDIRNYQDELLKYKSGGSIEEWQTKISSAFLVKQFMGEDFCEDDTPQNWYQVAQEMWAKNTTDAITSLSRRIKREFARPARKQNSLETLGLAEVVYPGLDCLSMPEELVSHISSSEASKILKKDWTSLLALLCDDIRSSGGITLGSDAEDQEYEFGSYLIGNWFSEDKVNPYTNLQLFVGVTERHQRRRFIEAVLRNLGLPSDKLVDTAKIVLQVAYSQLLANAGWDTTHNQPTGKPLTWLERDERELPRDTGGGKTPAIRIRLQNLTLRTPVHLYECQTTQLLWTRCIAQCAPEPGCTNLVEITAEEADRSPRYGRLRGELKESPIFEQGLWAVEHSAQLNPKENRRLQDLFKVGARNILSSTTTLELGIDIGGLNAVLMGNVPPGKANYLQRAGRAGRRADGSSVVVTFVRSRPFDLEVFQNFGTYLGRELRRPTVALERERIGRRHFHAWLLNEFFRLIYPPYTHVGAMRAFGDMGKFCGCVSPPKWEGSSKPKIPIFDSDWSKPNGVVWWNEEPSAPGLDEQFIAYLSFLANGNEQVEKKAQSLFADTGFFLKEPDWSRLLTDTANTFRVCVARWLEDYEALLKAWEEIPSASDKSNTANAIRYQLRTLYEITVIEALGDKQFLPRYGFPIGVLKLRVITPDKEKGGRIREEDQFRLERSGLLALREYIPGTQLLVGGKLITSRGLLKHWTGAITDDAFGLTGLYAQCTNGHDYYCFSGNVGSCPICNAHASGSPERLLFPKHGFTSAAWDKPRRSTDVEKVGSAEQATITFHKNGKIAPPLRKNVGGINGLNAYYAEGGEILVVNKGDNGNGFAICTRCGYAESERKKNKDIDLPPGFSTHTPLHIENKKIQCGGKNAKTASPLRKHILAAHETTDVLMLDISENYGVRGEASDKDIVLTFARALQAAGAKLLELDEREIGVMVVPTGEEGRYWGATLYDNVPGGAGHVIEMLNLGREWFVEARQLMYVSEEHHLLCETACLDCLLNFSAQFDSANLHRREAVALLDKLLDNATFGDMSEPDAPPITAVSLSENRKQRRRDVQNKI